MAQVVLNRARVVAVVGQLVAGAVAKHVAVYQEPEACGLPCSRDHALIPGQGQRRHSRIASSNATRAREGVTRKQHLLNRDGSIPSANIGGAPGAVSSAMRLFVLAPGRPLSPVR